MSDQLVAETSTDNTQHSQQTDVHAPPVGFETAISAGERPQTYTSDRATTGTGTSDMWHNKNKGETYLTFLKPTGHVMHQQFNIQQLYVLPTLYLCVLYLYENKTRLVPLTA